MRTADAQADLSLCRAHSHFVGLSCRGSNIDLSKVMKIYYHHLRLLKLLFLDASDCLNAFYHPSLMTCFQCRDGACKDWVSLAQ